MTSKLSKIFFDELEKLIKEAELISLELNPYKDNYTQKSTLALVNGVVNVSIEDDEDKYRKWNRRVESLLKKHGENNLLPHNFFIGLDITKDNNGKILRATSSYSEQQQDEQSERIRSKKYREKMNSELIRQVEILREIKDNLAVQKNIKKEEMIRTPEKTIENEELEEKIKISKTLKKIYPDLELKLKNGKGLLQLKKGGKSINVGGYNTRTYKLVRYILLPTSKSKNVADVYEHIKILKDDKNKELQSNTPRAYQIKKEIIEKYIGELQKEKFLKSHICKPIFDDKKKEVIFKFK